MNKKLIPGSLEDVERQIQSQIGSADTSTSLSQLAASDRPVSHWEWGSLVIELLGQIALFF
jgi:hypothetical protein